MTFLEGVLMEKFNRSCFACANALPETFMKKGLFLNILES